MATPIPQRVITISLKQINNELRAFYTFLSPLTGNMFIDAPSCDIECNQPTNTLFVLDFASSAAGWTIVDTSRKEPSLPLPHKSGPSDQSVQVYNPHIDDTTKYSFYINYKNTVTGETKPIDPQEGNIPRIYGNLD